MLFCKHDVTLDILGSGSSDRWQIISRRSLRPCFASALCWQPPDGRQLGACVVRIAHLLPHHAYAKRHRTAVEEQDNDDVASEFCQFWQQSETHRRHWDQTFCYQLKYLPTASERISLYAVTRQCCRIIRRTMSRNAAEEIRADAAVAAVSSKLDGVFTFKKMIKKR